MRNRHEKSRTAPPPQQKNRNLKKTPSSSLTLALALALALQVVAGTMMYLKVDTGKGFVHAKVFRSLPPATHELKGVQVRGRVLATDGICHRRRHHRPAACVRQLLTRPAPPLPLSPLSRASLRPTSSRTLSKPALVHGRAPPPPWRRSHYIILAFNSSSLTLRRGDKCGTSSRVFDGYVAGLIRGDRVLEAPRN